MMKEVEEKIKMKKHENLKRRAVEILKAKYITGDFWT